MITSKNLNFILLMVLFISLTIYHSLGVIQSKLAINTNQSGFDDYYNLITIVRIVITLVVMGVTLKSKIIAKLIFRENYIGGKYQGKSESHKNDKVIIHKEYFEIKQSLLETIINGMSKNENDEFTATWKGKLSEIDNKHFMFTISVNSRSKTHNGILNLRFDEGEAYGFYNSIILGKENLRRRFEAKKKDK